MQKNRENPLSGTTEMELVFGDYDNNGKIDIEEYRVPAIRQTGRQYQINLPILGAKEHAFTYRGNRKIGLGTNPGTSSVLTTVNASSEIQKGIPPNNRKVFLNGISVEILNIKPPVEGAIYVRIRFDDYSISQNARWCADTIVLSGMLTDKPRTISLHGNSQLLIDRGYSATRITEPAADGINLLYTNPTVFILEPNTELYLKDKSVLKIDNGSTIIVRSGASIRMDKKTSVIITGKSSLIFEQGSKLYRQKGSKIKISPNSELLLM